MAPSAWAVLLALALGGCGRGAAPKAGLAASCRSDRDCAYGLACLGAPASCVYEDYGACNVPADCLPGRTCREGRCTVACVNDRECDAGRRCLVGECRVDDTPVCVLPGDCPSGQECVAGRCQPSLRGPCLRDMDCAPPQRCLSGTCR